MFHLINRILAPRRTQPDGLYHKVMMQAREPIFYQKYQVQDTGDGRFDCLILHIILVLYVLSRKNSDKTGKSLDARFGRELIELMLEDFDHNFREMGVGDLAVGKRIKSSLKAFYGRMQAYEDGLSQEEEAGDQVLSVALERNLYRKGEVSAKTLAAICVYMRGQIENLQSFSAQQLREGDFDFQVLK